MTRSSSSRGFRNSYLQFVLLFQPKTQRIYWQLALLSLGQVAIASTLISGPIFAVILVSYIVLGIFAFALLLLKSDSEQCVGGLALATPAGSLSGAPRANEPILHAPRPSRGSNT